ncbi:MAG: Coronin-like protein crn1 [Caeruleum heppii]|nr:MAG: Coronin-like protein crn1 [Caeruleum heppii]
MSGRFVRASKYRHVFGKPTRKEQCYDNLRISKNAWDTNLVKVGDVNPQYLSVNWEAGGGGAFAVIPLSERGRLPEHIPLFRGHTAPVLDTDWSPFNDSLVVSGGDDGKVFVWRVPEDFTLLTDAEEPEDVAPIGRLTGHARKVGHVLFNTAAENILATSSGDYTVKLWDVEKGAAHLTLKHADIVQSLSWSANGSLLVTTSRDKKLRIWDVRQEKPAHEVPGHSGAKNSRAVWMGEHDRVATTGFSRMSDRQLGLWDIRDPKEPIGGFTMLDSISGVCMPFWDEGTQILYLAGKGDGNIRYYEYENDKFEYLSEYKSGDPQRGIAFLPKRGVNTHENEVARAFKSLNDAYIEPVSFIAPRRSEAFQTDIFPPTVGTTAGCSAKEWLGGKTALPPKIDLESVYNGDEEPTVVAATAPKTTATPTSPKSKKSPQKETAGASQSGSGATAVPVRGPPPDIKDQKTSISTMASKFADKAEDDEDDEEDDSNDDSDSDSDFEEVPTRKLGERKGHDITTSPTKTTTAAAARQADPAPSAKTLKSTAPPSSSTTTATTSLRNTTSNTDDNPLGIGGGATPSSSGTGTGIPPGLGNSIGSTIGGAGAPADPSSSGGNPFGIGATVTPGPTPGLGSTIGGGIGGAIGSTSSNPPSMGGPIGIGGGSTPAGGTNLAGGTGSPFGVGGSVTPGNVGSVSLENVYRLVLEQRGLILRLTGEVERLRGVVEERGGN